MFTKFCKTHHCDSEHEKDEVLKNKVESIYSILETFQEKSIDTDLLETVLRTQELVEELEKDGD